LLPFGGGNDREKVDDKKAVWAAFNGGRHGVRRRSGSKDISGVGGVGGGSSSKRRIGTGSSSTAARWWQHGLAMAARVCAKFIGDRALFVGGSCSES
jgi:hypothetical protein